MSSHPLTLLVDNGSLAPAATQALRALAAQLAARLEIAVEPVSLLHANAIDPQALAGRPAEILEPAIQRHLAAGQNSFLILPLFFGPSLALTEYLPATLARLRQTHPQLTVQLAPPLHASGDRRLAQILAEHVQAMRPPHSPTEPVWVALVDHGSPCAMVTAVRNELATQLAAELGPRAAAVTPCSMERRPAAAYDFNEPLLNKLLTTLPWSERRVIVALQFLLPGRHAGPSGDIAEICRQAEATQPGLRTAMTALVGDHPLLIEILADRWRSARALALD
jgi:sirohydrochlorin ferrochelatase